MPDNSVYNFIEVVGTSPESWEKAAANAIAVVAKTLRDLRIAEVIELDMQVEEGKIVTYRTKVKLSFRVEKEISE
jgi:dodecin